VQLGQANLDTRLRLQKARGRARPIYGKTGVVVTEAQCGDWRVTLRTVCFAGTKALICYDFRLLLSGSHVQAF
jgi:hypothetical protein